MVHALSEVRRTLKPGGWLIDLRPTKRNRRIQLEMAGRCQTVGELDASATAPERDAADAALRTAIADGQWRARHCARFEIIVDLDTPADLREHVKSLRRSRLPDDVLPRLETLMASREGLIRIYREMQIASYERI